MKEHIDKLNRLSESYGPLEPGKGMASGVVALMLAALCFLGVLVFHFPEYLSTPELRHAYERVEGMLEASVAGICPGDAQAAEQLSNAIEATAHWYATLLTDQPGHPTPKDVDRSAAKAESAVRALIRGRAELRAPG